MSGASLRKQGNFEELPAELASPPAPLNLKFERADWSLFRTVEGLQQKAGVEKSKLRRLVLKELADNGLDENAKVRIGELRNAGGYFVEDDGRGIDGRPEEIAERFSIARPMVSTKLLRLPTRGALGNGLRVVSGAVLASEGSLVVVTRNRRMMLRPERDGTTTVVGVEAVEHPVGTRIEISFGPALPPDSQALLWAKIACRMAGSGQTYTGNSSPWWYDVTQFHELLTASGRRPVRELIAHLDGCSGAKAGEIVTAAGFTRAVCQDITGEQAHRLLTAARESARQVKPERLGTVGPMFEADSAYACASGIATFGSAAPFAEVPFVVETWVEEREGDNTKLVACVNRTPVTGHISAARDGREINVFGCGLAHNIAKAPKEKHFFIWTNVTTPYMPITSDGKAPDLEPFFHQISVAIGKAVKKAHRPNATGKQSQKEIVLDNLDLVIADVSGDGQFRFNERQVLYRLRPIVTDETGDELKTTNFKKIITEYENEHGEIPRMYREPRGTVYHPHRNETIALGTLMVEDYERPEWTFNKLLYLEKEGFSEALKDVRWGERHDCALMSSKGFTTRAARDLVDKLAEHGEPITIFCVHDADAAGTLIYQTFQEETKARGARKITIVNLGLEPWEGIAMGLEVENVDPGERRKPVAGYVRERTDQDWEEWLQTHRIEINAMTTPRFIEWLDNKLAPYGGKLIPPGDVVAAELDRQIENKLRASVTERILREADFEGQVAATISAIKNPGATILVKGIKRMFKQKLDREWRDHIEAVANLKVRS
jgi:hypothetical protein